MGRLVLQARQATQAASAARHATFNSKLALAIIQRALLAKSQDCITPVLHALRLRKALVNLQVQRMEAKYSGGTQQTFLQLWREQCQLQRTVAAAHASAVQRHKQAAKVSVFAAWRSHMQQQQKLTALLGLRVSRRQRLQAAVLQIWRDRSRIHRAVAAAHASAVQRHKQATKVSVFAAWRSHMQQQHKLTALLDSRVSRRQRLQAAVLQAWRQWAQHQRVVATAGAGLQQQSYTGKKSSILRRWKLFLQLQNAKRRDLATVRQRSVNTACIGVLRVWRELVVAEQTEAASHEAKVRSGIQNLSHAAVFDTTFACSKLTTSIPQVRFQNLPKFVSAVAGSASAGPKCSVQHISPARNCCT